MLTRTAANVALLAVFGGLFLFYFVRFIRHRKWRSLVGALLPSGWIVFALARLGAVRGDELLEAVAWIGSIAGAAVLTLVVVAERVDLGDPDR